MNMKLLRSLQIFVEVAESGSMSIAARNLHMTVSAISQQLRKLEQDIGLSLFNRNTRNLSLTEAGRIYYDTSKKMLNTAIEAQERIETLQDAPSGKVNIIAPEGFGGGLLSQPLRKLSEDFPKIDISLTLTDRPTDIIVSGADLLLGFTPVSDTNFSSLELATWRRILCASADHPLAKSHLESPAILQEYSYMSHRHIEEYVIKHSTLGKVPLTSSRIELDSMQTLIQLTRDGLGYAVLPEPEVRHLLTDGSMKQLFTEWSLPDYTVYAVTPKRELVPAKISAAITCLQDWFSEI
ncbi:LysR family transcriptional regulator [Alteromonas sp. 38]|uniref:LysR family transcriptional regulator n=1 Tax=Alteromonas TaxID=226 RepID=UPI0012F0DA60|nr:MULTISPECIES: LysR family transcriptional regulator [Alteromonas]CAD5248554.1 LysR family transcriptional regulator [Alteromonas sp. 154]VXC50709.1 LysR family transcriptional regulator [Alteromonas sp. 38]